MPRAMVILTSREQREKAKRWIDGAPDNTRVEFKETKRTVPQNDALWGALSDVAAQKTHFGRRYSTAEWKAIFMTELGKEMQIIPKLHGDGFIPLGLSSSDLAVKEMSDLLNIIYAWGAENGVRFGDQGKDAA